MTAAWGHSRPAGSVGAPTEETVASARSSQVQAYNGPAGKKYAVEQTLVAAANRGAGLVQSDIHLAPRFEQENLYQRRGTGSDAGRNAFGFSAN